MKLVITMEYNKVLVCDAKDAADIVKAFSSGSFYNTPNYKETQYTPILDALPEMKFVQDHFFEDAPERLKVLQEEAARQDEKYWALYSAKNKVEEELKVAKAELARIHACVASE